MAPPATKPSADFDYDAQPIHGDFGRRKDAPAYVGGIWYLLTDTGNAGPAMHFIGGNLSATDLVIETYVAKPSDIKERLSTMSTAEKAALVGKIIEHLGLNEDFPDSTADSTDQQPPAEKTETPPSSSQPSSGSSTGAPKSGDSEA